VDLIRQLFQGFLDRGPVLLDTDTRYKPHGPNDRDGVFLAEGTPQELLAKYEAVTLEEVFERAVTGV